jgi:hypothetical protein
MNAGIFELHTPDEFLKKLAYDLRRLQADEGQQTTLYTAVDCFVTASSRVDRVKKYTALTPKEADALSVRILIQRCGALPNGRKHFLLSNPRGPPKTTLITHGTDPVYASGMNGS